MISSWPHGWSWTGCASAHTAAPSPAAEQNSIDIACIGREMISAIKHIWGTRRVDELFWL